MEMTKKYPTKSINTSHAFKVRNYVLLEMCLGREMDVQIDGKFYKELYDGPCILNDCRAYSARHAYEQFRQDVRESFDNDKMFISELEKLEDFKDNDNNLNSKWGFVVTVTNRDSSIVESHQFYIVESTEFIQQQLKMSIRVQS